MTDSGKNTKNRAEGPGEPPRVSGLGELLRKERERQGLNHTQVAQVTRLRRHFLQAIENEDWDNLPQPVFVRGFLKSYARALAIDEKRILSLYDTTTPAEATVPKLLLEPVKGRHKRLTLFILLIAVAGALYFLQTQDFFRSDTGSISQNEEQKTAGIKPEPQNTTTQPKQMEGLVSLGGTTVEQASVTEKAESPNKDPFKRIATPQSVSMGNDLTASATVLPPTGSVETGSTPTTVSAETETAATSGVTEHWHTLEGIVKQKTWIQIVIDGQESKEYIFQAGSHPQWKARERFSILVGNAAGIDFIFDGQLIDDLGILGQVVRLKLPAQTQAQTQAEP